MNQGVNGNKKLLWEEVSKANGGKVENYNRKRLKCGGFGRSILR